MNLLFIDTGRTEQLKMHNAISTNEESPYKVDASNEKRPGATTITIRGPDADGLLASVTTALAKRGCSLLEVHASSISQGVIEDTFVVQHGQEKKPIVDEELGDFVRAIHGATKKAILRELTKTGLGATHDEHH